MKKKLIRLASLWLAVIMLAGTAFAADVYFGVYTGVESLEQWDYVRDSMEEIELSSETGKFSLNTDAVLDVISESALGRELLGWNVWENISSGRLQDENPTNYEVDAIFTENQLSNQLVEPIWSDDVIRVFYIFPQFGAEHNDIIDMAVESDLLMDILAMMSMINPPIYHNFTDGGAFELTSDEVMAAVSLMDGYAVEGWRIWTPGEEEALAELSELDFDAVIEEGSELLQLECEGYVLSPIVSKLAEITVQPTSLSPTVETDADDNDELTKEYTWYSADEEIEAITKGTDASRLIYYDPDAICKNGKWYAVGNNEDPQATIVALSEREKLIVTTGTDDEEATPVSTVALLFVPIDFDENESDGLPLISVKLLFSSDGVFEYTAEEDCAVVPVVTYGTVDEPAEADGYDYATIDVLKRSDISVVEGEENATLKNGSFGERYFVEVKVSDEEGRSIILESDSFVHGYGITHQPTADEPYVLTNKEEDVVSYTWYQRSAESHILLDSENEYTLSSGEDGEEYFVEIEFIDETILISDYFEWKEPTKPAEKPSGGGGLQAGGDTSNKGADKFDKNEQTKPEDSAPTTPTTPSAPSDEPESTKLFDDVPAGSWFEEAAEWMGKNGYMSGTAPRTFSPNLNTTRGMIVTVLWRMAGSPAPTGECPFVDVAEGSYYEDAITWAAENGVVTGISEKTFAPDDLITREQLATIIYRNEVRKGMEALTMEENLTHFTDADAISEYAVTAMNWAVGQGIINGITETTLAPQKKATRAECATILYRMSNK